MSETFTLWKINDVLSFSYRFDAVSRVFLTVILISWAAAGVYSLYYMKDKVKLARYYTFYGLVMLVLVAMALSANMFTYYANYEFMTILSAPLVMHEETGEARRAGFKYLIYSFFGAYFVLFGFCVLYQYTDGLMFVSGGSLDMSKVAGHEGLVLFAVFSMILGFGVKAGMWPLHAWLTSAHPIAVSPASAVLSGVIVKAGVTGIIRVLYYITGIEFVKGTWVQYTWIVLTLLTVLMGSMLAYFEPVLKKRLAYSTISQASYILFGLSLFNDIAYKGAMLQFVAHAFAKCALFMIAGVLIHISGSVKVEDMKGIGRKHPVLMWSYIIAALSMIGIPPTGGFIAKWFLMVGAVDSQVKVIYWLGPVILLVSALLTAGYLLPLAIKSFIGNEQPAEGSHDDRLPAVCVVPIALLVVLSILVGVVPGVFVG